MLLNSTQAVFHLPLDGNMRESVKAQVWSHGFAMTSGAFARSHAAVAYGKGMSSVVVPWSGVHAVNSVDVTTLNATTGVIAWATTVGVHVALTTTDGTMRAITTLASGECDNVRLAALSASRFVVAYENVSDGGVGKVVALKATGVTLLGGVPVVFHDTFGGFSCPNLVPLGNNTASLVYRDDADSGKGKAVLVGVSGVDPEITISLGTLTTFANGSAVDDPYACRLGSSSLAVVFSDDLHNGVAKAQIGSPAGSGIVWYDPTTVCGESEVSNVAVAPLGATIDGKPRVVFTYTYPNRSDGRYEDGSIRNIGGNAISRVGTVSGDMFSLGAEADVNLVNGAMNQPCLAGLDNTRVALTYRDLSSGNRAVVAYGILCPTSNMVAWVPPSATLAEPCYYPRIAGFGPNSMLLGQISGTSMVLSAIASPDRSVTAGAGGYASTSGVGSASLFYRGTQVASGVASFVAGNGVEFTVRSSGLGVADASGSLWFGSSQVADRISAGAASGWHSLYWHVASESGGWRLWSSLDGSYVRDEGLGTGSGFIGTALSPSPSVSFSTANADNAFDEVTLWFGASRWTDHQSLKVQMLRTSGWLLTTYTDHVQSRCSGTMGLSVYGPNSLGSGLKLFVRASDMFDESHVVFYHPIDGHQEWTRRQEWEHQYRPVTGRVGSGMTTVVNDAVNLHTGVVAESVTAYHPRCGLVGCSQGRCINSLVNNADGGIYYWGAQVSGATIAQGSRISCPSLFTWVDTDMIPIGSDGAMSFRSRNVSPYQLVADYVWFSGSTLALNLSSGTIIHSSRCYTPRACVIDQSGEITRAAIFWITSTTSLPLGSVYGRVVTISGHTVTSVGALSPDLNADRAMSSVGTAVTQLQKPLVFNRNRVMLSWMWDSIYAKMVCIDDDGNITPSGEFFPVGSPDKATSLAVARLTDTKWAAVEQGSWGACGSLVEVSGSTLYAHPSFKFPSAPQVGGSSLSSIKPFNSPVIGISPSSFLAAANMYVGPYSGAIWAMTQSGIYFVSGSITPFTAPGENIMRCGLVKMTDQTSTSSGTACVVYCNLADRHAKCRMIAFSGTTVHVGSEFKFNAATTNALAACRMSDTTLGLIYLDAADLISRVRLATVSGLAIEYGTPTSFATHTSQDYFCDFPIESISESRVAFATCLTSSGVYKYWRVNTASLSGTTFVIGPALTQFTDTLLQFNNVGLTRVDANRMLLGFNAQAHLTSTRPPYGRTYLLGVSGSTPTVLSSGTFTPGERRSSGATYGTSPRIDMFGASGYMLSWLDESMQQFAYQSNGPMMRVGFIGADNTLANGDFIYVPPREIGWADHGFHPMRLGDNLGAIVWRMYYGSLGNAGGVNVVGIRLVNDTLEFSKMTSLPPIGQRQIDAAALNDGEIAHYEQYDGTVLLNGRWLIARLIDRNFIGKPCWTHHSDSSPEIWTSGVATIGVSGQTPGQGHFTLSPGIDASSDFIWFRYTVGGSTGSEYLSYASVTSSGLATATNPVVYPSCSGAQRALLTFWARKPFDLMTVNVTRGWNITLGDHRIMLSP